jgi:hypothetical protein
VEEKNIDEKEKNNLRETDYFLTFRYSVINNGAPVTTCLKRR